MYFNGTSKITICSNQVYLPYSSKPLTEEDVAIKIQKIQATITKLSEKLSNRNTHGGKSHRARQISINDQILRLEKIIAQLKNPVLVQDKQAKLINSRYKNMWKNRTSK